MKMADNGVGDKITSPEICILEATVVTGFEKIAKEECEEKLKTSARIDKGRIFFPLAFEEVGRAFSLKGVDNIYVVIHEVKNFCFPNEKTLVSEKLQSLASNIEWLIGLKVWNRYFSNRPKDIDYYDIESLKIESDFPNSDTLNSLIEKISTFRVTCYRSGQNHCFSSMEAAAYFGGAINDLYHWKADMKNHDIEIVLNISDDDLYVCISLTDKSLHKRNLCSFGPTSLRATVAYNMVRLGNIKDGDVVCDPMCGGGSIPIEAALNWPNAHHFCGDIHNLALPRTKQNIDEVNKKIQEHGYKSIYVHIFKWDVCSLPLRNNSIDVIITDLPFGRRLGSKTENRVLYPKFLEETARICRPRTGRAVLLTHDKTTMSKAIGRSYNYWKQRLVIGVNIGGLAACVFLLHRTDLSPESKVLNEK